MFGAPPGPGAITPETPQNAGTLTPSISITREPVGNEPFIQISYDVSMQVFIIALILHQLEREARQRAAAQETAAERETEAAKAEAAGKDTVTKQRTIGSRTCTTVRNLRDKKSGDNAAPDQ
jgi:hypothetical protein